MSSRDRQNRRTRRNHPEASYDEASRARYRVRAARPGGSGTGGDDHGLAVTRATFLGLLAIVSARLAYLQIFKHGELSSSAEAQRTNKMILHAKRGTIYDRNGNALAMSVDCQTIYANPKAVSDPSGVSNVLVSELGGEKDDYMELLTKDTTFVYVARQVDQEVADQLSKQLAARELTGVYFISDTKRVYPYGSTGAQVIGYVGTEGKGLSGLELYYDDILTGTDGEMIMEAGLDGTPIAGGASEVTDAKDGIDLVTSIDVDLQAVCEDVISRAVETYSAESGSVMVTDPLTGEILAACSTPLPDFSNLEDASSLNLKLVSSAFEPGSLFKVLTTSIGIEGGFFTEDTVYTVPPQVLVGDDYVTDVDGRDYTMDMSVRDMLVKSSNTAMAQLVQDVIGAEAFSEGVERYGIGKATGIDFPGEVDGIVRSLEEYDGATAGSMAFGQGLAIPLVQIVRAFGAVANGGVPLTPHFLVYRGDEQVEWPAGDRVISEETVAQEIDMMRGVMAEGSGTTGQVEGYDFAGKTGTGEQASEDGGYRQGSYVSSLCAFANAEAPEILVYVGLNNTPYLSSGSAGVAFKEIAQQAVSILGVSPAS
ncbi:MAG TPA: penicillin-binding protein 2 [Candidatus Olsenella excrementavium]|uniref:Penicillin-binding protein 2 n=1 Tax=Candidatus Olsenella excrementavium TaxID=2838709 RepID=A0A9D1ZAC0_9ACTN|nr:penicillin-binding protein 2 [Candidatus Olsenella excrementavium]